VENFPSLHLMLEGNSVSETSYVKTPSRKSSTSSACRLLVPGVAYYSALKMEVILSSETSVDFYQTKLRCNPEIRTHNTYLFLQFVFSRSEPPCFAANAVVTLSRS
jgi:hypothetical protein